MSSRTCCVAAFTVIALACSSGNPTTSPPALVDHVTISGAAAALALGTQLNLTALAYDANDVALTDRNFAWASSDSATASVLGSGGYATVTAHAAGGPVTITATLHGIAGAASLSVTQAPTIHLSASALTFAAVANGGPIAVQSVTVTNTGTGSLTNLAVGPISYVPAGSWITTASFNPTTAPAILTLGVDNRLAAGTYSATVPVTSTASGVTNAPSITVTLVMSPSLDTSLVLVTPPSDSATINVPLAIQPVLQLRDPNGTPVPLSGVVITATLATGSGTLSGTTTVTTDAAGAAAFTNLSLSVVGTNTIGFSATVNGHLLSVTSQSIVVSLPPARLTIQAAGTGSGTVTSSPGGINCTSSGGTTSGTCSATYGNGTPVTLTAIATSGTFAGWSGACVNDAGPCLVTMSQDQSTTARFVSTAPQITILGAGTGSGSVTAPATGGQPALNCTITNGNAVSGCSQSYPAGTHVPLTATGTGGGAFTGWSGTCTGFLNPCTVTDSTTVTASFVPPGNCPDTAFSLGIAVTGTLTSACPAYASYYATYRTPLVSAQTIAVTMSASFDPAALAVQVSSTGSAIGLLGSSPLQFKILAGAGELTLFPGAYTAGTTGTFSFTASPTLAFIANCEFAILVPGGTWNENLSTGACTSGPSYYDAYLIEIPAGATATLTMTSSFGPVVALYDSTNATLVASAAAQGGVAITQYTNSSGHAALYHVHATSASAGLIGPYSLSYGLTGPGSIRQAGSPPVASPPVWVRVPAYRRPP